MIFRRNKKPRQIKKTQFTVTFETPACSAPINLETSAMQVQDLQDGVYVLRITGKSIDHISRIIKN